MYSFLKYDLRIIYELYALATQKNNINIRQYSIFKSSQCSLRDHNIVNWRQKIKLRIA